MTPCLQILRLHVDAHGMGVTAFNLIQTSWTEVKLHQPVTFQMDQHPWVGRLRLGTYLHIPAQLPNLYFIWVYFS